MPAATASQTSEIFETLIPARLDRLPWCRFHWMLVIGLGITWVLDGLEITLMGAISAVLQRPDVLHFTAAEIGSISSAYLAGAVIGSLIFGHLTDRFGRRTFFFVTLAIYLLGVGLTALSWNLWSFALFRFITGAGIGGEYSAVNSAIDELIPARFRGRVDLMINGSFWLGAALGSISTVVILNPHILPINLGWRFGFGAGAIIGMVILYLREFIPGESALAHHARSARRGRENRARRRRRGASRNRRAARRSASRACAANSRAPRFRPRRDPEAAGDEVQNPRHPRPHADERAGLPLQRGTIYLRAGTESILWSSRRQDRALHAAVRAGKFSRTGRARAFFRYHRTPPDDRCDLRDFGAAADPHRLSLHAQCALNAWDRPRCGP